jgi:hypothetical protein
MAATRVCVYRWACQCEWCGHLWYTQEDSLPRRCVNHGCRSVLWNVKPLSGT